MTPYAVLFNTQLPQPALLDAIRYSETGHLSDDAAKTAVSPKGAVGPYQFMQKFLHDFGYGMPKNIPLTDVQDLSKSRQLADMFITGYSDYHQFTTPLEKLVAYNAGPQFAAKWKAAGSNIADLPSETQKYVQKAAAFLTQNQGNDDMATPAFTSFMNPEDDWHHSNVADAQGMGANSFVQGILERLFLENQAKQRAAASMGISGDPSLDEGAEFTSIAPPTRFIGTPYMGSATQPQAPALSNVYSGSDNPEDEYFIGNINDAKNAAEKRRQRQMTLEEDYQMGKRTGQFIYEENIRRYEREYPQNPKPNAYAGMDNPEDDYNQSNAAEAERLSGDNRPASNYVGPYPMGSTQAPILDQSQSSAGVLSGNPALTYNSTPASSSGLNGQVSQNRRDMSALSMVPAPTQIGLNEMLIRMGAAGLGASAEGGLQALGAIGDTYGQIQDANRATGLAAYKAQMEALKDGTSAKQKQENMERVGQIDATLYDMDRALGYLERDGMNLTGFFDSTFGAAWDNIVGNPEASARLLLKKLRVDDTLLRVAQTKGAISNKEMDLFMSPAPSDTQDEQVWIDWIKERQIALRDIRRRLATGEQASNPASSAQIDQFSRQPQQQGGNFADADAIVGIN